MRWGPVVAGVVAAVALVAAAFTGIATTDADRRVEFGLVRLDGLVGEVLLIAALGLVAWSVLAALGRVPSSPLIAIGVVTAVITSVSRSSLSSDASLVREYIEVAGSATGVDSRLVDAAGGSISGIDVDANLALLALGGAAALVAVGWTAWVELDGRRRARRAASSSPDADGSGPITESSQLPHT